MNILIFGATGKTGRELLIQGLKKEHHITAFVRNPHGLSLPDRKLTVIQGDISNEKHLEKVMKGQHVVMSVLGNKTSNALWKPNTVISDATECIISAMKKQKVKRLLFVTSFGVNEEVFLPEKILLRTVLKNLFADIPRQEMLIKQSGLDWTIVHPARLVTTPWTGIYKRGEHLPIDPYSKIGRSDVADFLLKSISNPELIKKTVTISY